MDNRRNASDSTERSRKSRRTPLTKLKISVDRGWQRLHRPEIGNQFVRVTDSRDGQTALARRINNSSFNMDSSRFVVSLDGVAMLYSFDPSLFLARKQGPLFVSIELQATSCQWSAADADTIFGLDSADAARLYAYNTKLGSYTLLKDFSGLLGNGRAEQLSKSWFDDNHFAFTWREIGSSESRAAMSRATDDSRFFLRKPARDLMCSSQR